MSLLSEKYLNVMELADKYTEYGDECQRNPLRIERREEELNVMLWESIHGEYEDFYMGYKMWKAVFISPPTNIEQGARWKFAATELRKLPRGGFPIKPDYRFFLPKTKIKEAESQMRFIMACVLEGGSEGIEKWVHDSKFGKRVISALVSPNWRQALEGLEAELMQRRIEKVGMK